MRQKTLGLIDVENGHELPRKPVVPVSGHCVDCGRIVEVDVNGGCVDCGSKSIERRPADLGSKKRFAKAFDSCWRI